MRINQDRPVLSGVTLALPLVDKLSGWNLTILAVPGLHPRLNPCRIWRFAASILAYRKSNPSPPRMPYAGQAHREREGVHQDPLSAVGGGVGRRPRWWGHARMSPRFRWAGAFALMRRGRRSHCGGTDRDMT